MKILALDASGQIASVALAENDRLIGEYTTNTGKTHSETLLPMVDALATLTGEDLSAIDAIAVAYGPGSFTGLRIGSATAKGLAFAYQKPIIEIPTVDAIAWNVAGVEGYAVPILDARRQQTYTGIYRFEIEISENVDQSSSPVTPRYQLVAERAQCATTIQELVEDLNARGQRVTFLGDGVPVFRSYIEENLRVPYIFAPIHERLQRAGAVASLAMYYAEQGEFTDGADHRPEYLRETQAERERKAK